MLVAEPGARPRQQRGGALDPQRFVFQEPRQPVGGVGGLESTQSQVLADALLMFGDRLLPAGVSVDRLGVGSQLQGGEPQDLAIDLQGRLARKSAEHTHEGDLVGETQPVVVAPPPGDLVAGRTFTDRDTTDAPAAVMVSESLVRYLWPSGDAVGRRLIAVGAEAESDDAPAWHTVVGIVEDARYRELDRGRFDLYVPFTQVSMSLNHLVIRTEGDPARLAAALRSEVQRADPNFVIDSIAPLRGLVDDVMRPWRFNMTMAALLAGLATGLAAIGLFGTVAYGVTRRTREIGVRRALGAQAVDVLRLVWGQAVVLTLLGAAIGLGVALPTSELLRPLLFDVAPREAGAFAVLTALLFAACAAASLLAAWRATRIDPLVALRESE